MERLEKTKVKEILCTNIVRSVSESRKWVKGLKALLYKDIFKGRSYLNITHTQKVVTRACVLRAS